MTSDTRLAADEHHTAARGPAARGPGEQSILQPPSVATLDVRRLAIPEVLVITPHRHIDVRGHFAETFNLASFAAIGIDITFVQDNQSLSRQRGVVRGLHMQIPPMTQAKLVRVIRGAIRDVAVDLRPQSPTYLRHVAVELSAENFSQIYIPAGFAHGFVTLAPETEVAYKVSGYYSPPHERGIRFDDPQLGIDWGIDPRCAVLSDQDRALPLLADRLRDGSLCR